MSKVFFYSSILLVQRKKFNSHSQQETNIFTESKGLRFFLPAGPVTATNATAPIQRPTPSPTENPTFHKFIELEPH